MLPSQPEGPNLYHVGPEPAGLRLPYAPLAQQPREVLAHAAPLDGRREGDRIGLPVDEAMLRDLVERARRLGEEAEQPPLAIVDHGAEAVEPLAEGGAVH